MIRRSNSISSPFILASLVGYSLIATIGIAPRTSAQSVQVNGPNVECENPEAKVAAPNVGVSAPNPSRLVPNVGKILRKGLGLPVPDSEAPDVEAKVAVTSPSVDCANGNAQTQTMDRGSSTQYSVDQSSSMSGSGGVSGLW